MADGTSDLSLLQGAIGIIAALFSAACGHLHIRINRVEDSTRQMIDAAAEARANDDREKWRAINGNRQAFDEFARTVVTKEDLRDFESRIVRLLDARARSS